MSMDLMQVLLGRLLRYMHNERLPECLHHRDSCSGFQGPSGRGGIILFRV
jgi:hypothetical protein